MNQVFQAFKGRSIVVYFDEVQEKTHLSFTTCFESTSSRKINIVFLGFFVSSNGVDVDLEKIKVIQESRTAKTV